MSRGHIPDICREPDCSHQIQMNQIQANTSETHLVMRTAESWWYGLASSALFCARCHLQNSLSVLAAFAEIRGPACRRERQNNSPFEQDNVTFTLVEENTRDEADRGNNKLRSPMISTWRASRLSGDRKKSDALEASRHARPAAAASGHAAPRKDPRLTRPLHRAHRSQFQSHSSGAHPRYGQPESVRPIPQMPKTGSGQTLRILHDMSHFSPNTVAVFARCHSVLRKMPDKLFGSATTNNPFMIFCGHQDLCAVGLLGQRWGSNGLTWPQAEDR